MFPRKFNEIIDRRRRCHQSLNRWDGRRETRRQTIFLLLPFEVRTCNSWRCCGCLPSLHRWPWCHIKYQAQRLFFVFRFWAKNKLCLNNVRWCSLAICVRARELCVFENVAITNAHCRTFNESSRSLRYKLQTTYSVERTHGTLEKTLLVWPRVWQSDKSAQSHTEKRPETIKETKFGGINCCSGCGDGCCCRYLYYYSLFHRMWVDTKLKCSKLERK